MRRVALLLSFLLANTLSAAETLRVVTAGPSGEVATLAEANEVRVVFSEPMVVVGRIPQPVTAPFFRIEPAVKGTFRWSGTTTLIFTPDPGALPYAQQYTVTIERSARSVAGNTLDRDYSFSFTTPTIRLLRTQWYRKGGQSGAPVVIGLRFNQPVEPQTVVRHLQLRTVAHEYSEPVLPESGVTRLQAAEPQAVAAFQKKRGEASRRAASNGERVLAFLATEWDHNRIEPGTDLVVVETKPGVPPDTWLQVHLDGDIAASPRSVRRGKPQEYIIQLEPSLFVERLSCYQRCDPESGVFLEFRSQAGLRLKDVKAAVSIEGVTQDSKTSEFDYPSNAYSLDVLGYELQPARSYVVRVDPSLRAEDGQTLGYTWMGVVEMWHRSAFISFGDGQGVWEASGGTILPFHARNLNSVKQWLAPLSIENTMPLLIEMRRNGFRTVPADAVPQNRMLRVISDKIQSFGLDVSSAVGSDGKGLLWAAMQPGDAIPQSRIYDPMPRATVVQVTNLGLSVKDSPLNTLILVTRLDDGQPVGGANVSIRTKENKVFWSGVTAADGIAIAPNTDLRRTKAKAGDPNQQDMYDSEWYALGEIHFVVTA
ncbi:MAG TPA: Ig-like domain-containing protein, partial [Thermoanaerobaculia bacterium]|nr:Ig-like domain-containing protein [Thermoanaerobaculia bacterium]